ncbi:MAG: hypothetical protein A2W80_04000 [Candidatus Riflebacteria bacterium GWC2_50_8]|nr:MAG: hypothetical protein A2W80_04000 [Candidatus Riflebacteria bacterium GWC2_50_8]
MLTKYIETAMKHANYEMIDDEQCFYGEIPGFKGVYASAANLEVCRNELSEVLEEWIFFRVYNHLDLPEVDGIRLQIIKDLVA